MNILTDVNTKTIADLLRDLKGKEVTLLLKTGERIGGTLPDTQVNYGSQLTKMVHLTALTNQDYFDAVLTMDSIIGVIIRHPDK